MFLHQYIQNFYTVNQINDSKHILDILQNSLIEYEICESTTQCDKICVSIFDEFQWTTGILAGDDDFAAEHTLESNVAVVLVDWRINDAIGRN